MINAVGNHHFRTDNRDWTRIHRDIGTNINSHQIIRRGIAPRALPPGAIAAEFIVIVWPVPVRIVNRNVELDNIALGFGHIITARREIEHQFCGVTFIRGRIVVANAIDKRGAIPHSAIRGCPAKETWRGANFTRVGISPGFCYPAVKIFKAGRRSIRFGMIPQVHQKTIKLIEQAAAD